MSCAPSLNNRRTKRVVEIKPIMSSQPCPKNSHWGTKNLGCPAVFFVHVNGVETMILTCESFLLVIVK